jgi:putative FmdB family regulatory protein
MPIYEYACKNCNYTLDALQKMSEDPLVECPECGKPTLKRLISAPRFRLKGQGWYETDFKKDNQRNLAVGDSDKVKSDVKPDTKDAKDTKETKKTPDTKDSKKTESIPKAATKNDSA